MTFYKAGLAPKILSDLLGGRREKPTLLLLSGGSAFKVLDGLETENLSSNVTISVLDERFSQDQEISNFLILKKTEFFRKVESRGCKFFSTVPEDGETPETLAERFAHQMKDWRTENPDGKIIITQGMGEDGHTAGIMPYPEDPELFQKLFIEGTNWVAGYDAGNKNQYPLRVTTRINFLREQVDTSIFYVTGESKKNILKKVLDGAGKINELPALVIHEMKDVRVFSDIYPGP
jgi:6-phosphogluconolactonase/glucosamine-6-phosphate isomerase/deaminase